MNIWYTLTPASSHRQHQEKMASSAQQKVKQQSTEQATYLKVSKLNAITVSFKQGKIDLLLLPASNKQYLLNVS